MVNVVVNSARHTVYHSFDSLFDEVVGKQDSVSESVGSSN